MKFLLFFLQVPLFSRLLVLLLCVVSSFCQEYSGYNSGQSCHTIQLFEHHSFYSNYFQLIHTVSLQSMQNGCLTHFYSKTDYSTVSAALISKLQGVLISHLIEINPVNTDEFVSFCIMFVRLSYFTAMVTLKLHVLILYVCQWILLMQI